MVNMNNLLIIGAQGSGKGTQAEMLSKKLKIPHIATGDIFRSIRTQNTPLGKQVRELIDNGSLVPDEIVIKIVKERLNQGDAKKGFLLDGFPRNLSQAEQLDAVAKIKRCIVLEIKDSESIKRISARRLCEKCKAGYNTIYLKPKKEGICDACGGNLVIRDDDKPEAVKLRLKQYHEATEPVIKHYEKKKVLLRINGEQTIEKVFEDIVAGLK